MLIYPVMAMVMETAIAMEMEMVMVMVMVMVMEMEMVLGKMWHLTLLFMTEALRVLGIVATSRICSRRTAD